MKHFEERLLEQYHIDIHSKRRVRGGFVCDTEQGLLLLSNVNGAAKKVTYINHLCNQLAEGGRENIDVMLLDKEGKYVNSDREQGDFVLKKWYIGRECDIRRNMELFHAVRELAKLHIEMQEVSNNILEMQKDLEEDKRWNNFVNENLIGEYERHNIQLNKVRNYIRGKRRKGRFETLYVREFDMVYEEALRITNELKESDYASIYKHAVDELQLVHGDFNYHNILFTGSNITITNFNKFKIDLQVADLYNFMRKVLEKRGWDVYLGADLISAYEEVRMLSDAECEYIRLRLSYPEKYWKITNAYYNSNKAWVSDQIVDKLEKEIRQMCIKAEFVEKLFNK